MSDTPRTDAVVKVEWLHYEKLARQLERELAAMTLEKNLADARLAGIERIYQEKVMELNKIIDQREAQSTRMEGE